MYLIDTSVISEIRKGPRSNPGVRAFFKDIQAQGDPAYISAITVGELRRGVEKIRHRGDRKQADLLAGWLEQILNNYRDFILPFDGEIAQVWGKLRVPHYENALDKQIAATALIHDLAVVTRNTRDFAHCGVRLLNPFIQD